MTRNDFETRLPLEAQADKLHSGWADEASSGTYPGRVNHRLLRLGHRGAGGEALDLRVAASAKAGRQPFEAVA